MKKITSIILIFVGIIIITVSFTMFFKNDEKNNENSFKINTSEMLGNKFDNSEYDIYSYNDGFSSDYVKTHNITEKNKILFPVLKNMSTYSVDITEFFKEFSLDNLTIIVNVIPSYSVDEYMEKLIFDYKNGDFEKLNYSQSQKIVNDDNVEFSYIKFQYMYRSDTDYSEDFYILLKSAENEITLIRYNIMNQRFSDIFLTEIAQNIKIEKNTAQYLISTKKDNELVGTLKQKKPNTINEDYQLTYKVSSEKYQEIENENNTQNYTTFTKLDDTSTLINIELKAYQEETLEGNIIEHIKESIYNTYMGNEDKEYKPENYEVKDIVFENKYYTMISFNYNLNNEIKHYYIYIDEIDDYAACVITISPSNASDVISDFTNYTINSNI